MPKTNHEREFSDKRDYTCPPGDWVNGKHGAARDKRGGKKFRRSRQRFHQNAQLTALMDEDASLEPSKFDIAMIGRSKLRQTSGSGHEPWECGNKKLNQCVGTRKPKVLIGEEMLCKGCYSRLKNLNASGPLVN